MIIAQPKELIGAFVNVRQGLRPDSSWGDFNALGLIRGGRLVAGVIYNNFGGANANMHVGAEEGARWMTRDFLRAAFDYPFNQLKLRRLTACVHSNNRRAIRFDEHLGFKYEGTQRHYYTDGDMLIFGMLREECRFLERKAA